MSLLDAIRDSGMTPPKAVAEGRWVRFPGIGKGRSNRSGWCRLITPTLAIYGDWSSGLTATWKDEGHLDTVEAQRQLKAARQRETEFNARQKSEQERQARFATKVVENSLITKHAYLAAKGFPEMNGLVYQGDLIVPVRAGEDYRTLITVQRITHDGIKRFLPGSRAKGGIYRLGADRPTRIVLCEGYATGLSLDCALSKLPGRASVIVCFSAQNLIAVAAGFPGAIVCADNDASNVGAEAARRTGLKWVMPPSTGDFNDLHAQHGIFAVVNILRALQ